ncbi:COX15/CtaA family protein [Undibacterium sp. Ren11W]|uniref:COX15/CtaA family protein n=1 Tax=Undibacterium sp. Ren11W TaxID=3413045 RepID=UPI003BF0EDB7
MWPQLFITALLVALLPLSLVWVSDDANKYRKLIGVTLFLTLDLIVFGAFTRLTDSGLGCPDWPGCYGQANPLQSLSAIKSAQILMPNGPVTLQKAWIEMIHRYLAMCVGVLIVAQMCIAWWRRSRLKHTPWLATALFLFVCLQGAFGAWTVTRKLQPLIVTTHLLLGMGLLALLTWAWVREGSTILEKHIASSLISIATLALLLLFIQIALGGWVSTNYAALACHDYPLCNGALIPQLDFEHAFSLWRQLGQTANGEFLPFSALVAIQWVHRSFAWLVVLIVLYLVYRVKKIPALRGIGKSLLLFIFLQLLSGASTVFFSWPLLIAVLHNAGAALLVLLLCMLNYRVRHAAAP